MRRFDRLGLAIGLISSPIKESGVGVRGIVVWDMVDKVEEAQR